MNILGNNAAKLNEVIFQNRNKDYGAYAIRSSYYDSLKKSLLFVGSLVLLLFTSVGIYNKVNAKTDNQKLVILDELNNHELVYEVNMEQPKPPTPEPVQQMAAAAAPSGGVPRIVDETGNHETIDAENLTQGKGPDDASGTSITSTLVTTNTVQTISVSSGTTTAETGPVYIADEMPEYEGGVTGLMRFISQNISYPELAKQIGKEGTVYVSFVVNEIGYVEAASVVRGIGFGCDEEVIRVMNKIPRWKKAGKNNGHPVKVRYNIPVCFKLK